MVLTEVKAMEKQLIVWQVISYSWVDTELDEEDYKLFAKELVLLFEHWDEINKIAISDVCASFAVEAFLVFPCMLWMIMPDWFYDDDYLKRRIQKWHSKPKWMYFLNPIRMFGFPVALWMSRTIRRKLKHAYQRQMAQESP